MIGGFRPPGINCPGAFSLQAYDHFFSPADVMWASAQCVQQQTRTIAKRFTATVRVGQIELGAKLCVVTEWPRCFNHDLYQRHSEQKGVTNMKKTTTLILVGGAAALLAGLSIAQNSKNQSHLVDTYGTHITTRSETEVCVRRSEWTPARVGASCDPVVENAAAPASKIVAATLPHRKPATAPVPQ